MKINFQPSSFKHKQSSIVIASLRSAQTCCDRSSPLRECKELKEFREFREPRKPRKPIAKLLKFPKLPVTLTTLIRQPPYLKEWSSPVWLMGSVFVVDSLCLSAPRAPYYPYFPYFPYTPYFSRASTTLSSSRHHRLLWHYFCHDRGQREWSEKGNFSLSLICLHIFLLFSVCTLRPSFFLLFATSCQPLADLNS